VGSLGISLRLGGGLHLGILSRDCVVVGLNASCSSSLVNASLGLLLASLVGSLQVGDLLGILVLHFCVVGFGLGGGSHRQP
jgi:hypothetical protein